MPARTPRFFLRRLLMPVGNSTATGDKLSLPTQPIYGVGEQQKDRDHADHRQTT
jgi:hypothetical protein